MISCNATVMQLLLLITHTMYVKYMIIIFARRLCFHQCSFVSVCLLARLIRKLWMDFDEIFRKCQKCNEEQLIRFW